MSKLSKYMIALVTAVALAFSMTACTFGTPDTVGTIGETEIPSGLYLLLQFQSFNGAAGYASADQKKMTVSKFLNETITVKDDANLDDGDYLVSDYVAKKTMILLEYYAAVEQQFAAYEGELEASTVAYNESYAEYIMTYQKDLYLANGFAEPTLLRYLNNQAKAYELLKLKYGKDGSDALKQSEVDAYVASDVYFGQYFSVALSASGKTYSDKVIDAMTDLAKEAAKAADEGKSMDEVATEYLPKLYEAAEAKYDEETDKKLNSTLYTKNDLTDSYGENVAKSFSECKVGSTIAVRMGANLYVFQRQSLEGNKEYDEDYLWDLAVEDLMNEDLQAWLFQLGAEYPHNLDAAAMKQMPAKKIRTE